MGKGEDSMVNNEATYDLDEIASTPKRKSTRNNSMSGTAGQLTWSTVETTATGEALPITPPCNRLASSGSSWLTVQYSRGCSSSASSSCGGASSGTSCSGMSRLGSSSGGDSGATPKWFLGSPRVRQLRVTESTKRESVLEYDFKGMHFSRQTLLDAQSSVCGADDAVTESGRCLPSMVAGTSDAALSRTAQKSNNPFEGDHWLETMHLSSFSPSVFSKVVTPSKDQEFGQGTFNWGLENAAMLYPNEFEDSQHQNVSTPCDHERESQIQKQIDAYFSKNNCVPSPWLLNNSKNMEFSPHLSCSVQTNCHGKERKTSVPQSTNNASTQTSLTLPVDFDLEKILACYFTYNGRPSLEEGGGEPECDARESFSNSSLRRKLFVNDDSRGCLENSSKNSYLSALCTNDNDDGGSTPATHMRAFTPENRDNDCSDPGTSLTMDFVSPDGARTSRAQCHSLSPLMGALSPNVSPIHTGAGDPDGNGEDNDGESMMSISCSQPNTPQPYREQKKTVRDCNRSLDLHHSPDKGKDIEKPIVDIYRLTDNGPSWHESIMPSTIYMETSSSVPSIRHGTATESSSCSAGLDNGYHTMSDGSRASSASSSGLLQQPSCRTNLPEELCSFLPSQVKLNLMQPPGGCLWLPLGSSTPSRANYEGSIS